ncbi:hypothetical protein [Kocuria nitroreducens]|uniref:hypothetical protein n=1 Tax=Kocuria nitroreducens TaxID=3058914 RepID=UPI0036DAB305
MPVRLLWGGFAIDREWQAVASSVSLLFALWGIPFVLVGLCFMVGRFVCKKRRPLSDPTVHRRIVAHTRTHPTRSRLIHTTLTALRHAAEQARPSPPAAY